MELINRGTQLGVIVGRYQVDQLHEGHIECLRYVSQRHNRLLILVGVRDTPPTETAPLPYYIRRDMIIESMHLYASGDVEVHISPLEDNESDEMWSKNLDNTIKMVAGPDGAILYCGRDGFVKHYSGKYQTEIIPVDSDVEKISSTKIREDIAKIYEPVNINFRRGMIYQMQNLIPRTYETVDVALIRRTSMNTHEVLLGRKTGSMKFRFIGGHVEPQELTINAARRELFEETGVITEESLKLVGEFLLKDWRVRDTQKAFYRTFFYVANYFAGVPQANDDIEEVRWFPMNLLQHRPDFITDTHLPLLTSLINYLSPHTNE